MGIRVLIPIVLILLSLKDFGVFSRLKLGFCLIKFLSRLIFREAFPQSTFIKSRRLVDGVMVVNEIIYETRIQTRTSDMTRTFTRRHW
ncbi:hypothetical protein QL285_060917 [Trifolium repens]|nr:hypothetical protein QL285_060917 [Trifolium repens]